MNQFVCLHVKQMILILLLCLLKAQLIQSKSEQQEVSYFKCFVTLIPTQRPTLTQAGELGGKEGGETNTDTDRGGNTSGTSWD